MVNCCIECFDLFIPLLIPSWECTVNLPLMYVCSSPYLCLPFRVRVLLVCLLAPSQRLPWPVGKKTSGISRTHYAHHGRSVGPPSGQHTFTGGTSVCSYPSVWECAYLKGSDSFVYFLYFNSESNLHVYIIYRLCTPPTLYCYSGQIISFWLLDIMVGPIIINCFLPKKFNVCI